MNEKEKKLGMTFDEFYNNYRKFIINLLYNIKPSFDCEGIADEAFAHFWNKFDLYDETKGKPITYLTTIARNLLFSQIKSEKLEYIYTPIDIDETSYLDYFSSLLIDDNDNYNDDIDKKIKAITKVINDYDCEIVNYWWRGFSYIEMRERTGLNISTIKSRVHQFKRKFRRGDMVI